MKRHTDRTGQPGGFTLLELLIVCLVVGVVATIGLPRLMPQRMAPDQGAQVVMSTLMFAQRLAVTEQRNVIVSFDLTRGEAQVHVDADHDGERGEGEQVMYARLGEDVRFGAGGASPRSGDTPPATFAMGPAGHPAVTFHRNGSASSAGAVYLTARGARPADTKLVAVERATGRAEMMRTVDGTWVPARRR